MDLYGFQVSRHHGVQYHYYNAADEPANEERDGDEWLVVKSLVESRILHFADPCIIECHESARACLKCQEEHGDDVHLTHHDAGGDSSYSSSSSSYGGGATTVNNAHGNRGRRGGGGTKRASRKSHSSHDFQSEFSSSSSSSSSDGGDGSGDGGINSDGDEDDVSRETSSDEFTH